MMTRIWFLSCLMMMLVGTGCGYKWVAWSSSEYRTLAVRAVKGDRQSSPLRVRMRDALIERCLAGSGFKPTDDVGDLVLNSTLLEYRERVIATGADGRTSRIQFSIRMDFVLTGKDGAQIWALRNYQLSEQFPIAIGQGEYRDESVFRQDQAMRIIADLVITNITLAIAELGAEDE